MSQTRPVTFWWRLVVAALGLVAVVLLLLGGVRDVATGVELVIALALVATVLMQARRQDAIWRSKQSR